MANFSVTLKSFLLVFVSVCSISCSLAQDSNTPPQEYLTWLDSLKTEMLNKGISAQTIDSIYGNNTYYHSTPKAVIQDRKQPEFIFTSYEYINKVITSQRIELARIHYKNLRPRLQLIENKYNFPKEYIIAFWGLETNFGQNLGNYNVFDALTEMSYDKRRRNFFKNELYNALKIVDTSPIKPIEMESSWAGAMGNFQFMPSTYNKYAVDFNSDGKIDVWHDFDDAAASAANYLSSIGWNSRLPWGFEVKLPWDFNYKLTGRDNPKDIKYWKSIGVRTLSGKALNLPLTEKAAIIIPDGKSGRAYLITNNFYKIMKWNNSENYALAIGFLADYTKSSKKWQKLAPKGQKLKTKDVIAVQKFINSKNIAQIKEDGQIGRSTRKAVKKLQKSFVLPQDGYPDAKLLHKINKYNPDSGMGIPVPQRKLHKPK